VETSKGVCAEKVNTNDTTNEEYKRHTKEEEEEEEEEDTIEKTTTTSAVSGMRILKEKIQASKYAARRNVAQRGGRFKKKEQSGDFKNKDVRCNRSYMRRDEKVRVNGNMKRTKNLNMLLLRCKKNCAPMLQTMPSSFWNSYEAY
jgi:hypothetical protein